MKGVVVESCSLHPGNRTNWNRTFRVGVGVSWVTLEYQNYSLKAAQEILAALEQAVIELEEKQI